MNYYRFIFSGHEYTSIDRASNQGRCPHCNHPSYDGFLFNKDDDNESFIGYYEFDEHQCALCFECPECFEKFFYHMPLNYSFIKADIKDWKIGRIKKRNDNCEVFQR